MSQPSARSGSQLPLLWQREATDATRDPGHVLRATSPIEGWVVEELVPVEYDFRNHEEEKLIAAPSAALIGPADAEYLAQGRPFARR